VDLEGRGGCWGGGLGGGGGGGGGVLLGWGGGGVLPLETNVTFPEGREAPNLDTNPVVFPFGMTQ